jgi:hypothetical protein
MSPLLLGLLFATTNGGGSSIEPARSVHGSVLRSDRDPAVQVTLPKDATYIGSDKWILFGVANCQLFAFVTADSAQKVERLYWVQFESYLPSLPKLHHSYDSKQHASLGGIDFYVDTFRQSGKPPPPDTRDLVGLLQSSGYAIPAGMSSGSDQQHIDALITSKGYNLATNLLAVRFVHTFDAERKELMIIYSEPFRSNRVPSEGARRALVRRAEALLTITQRNTVLH